MLNSPTAVRLPNVPPPITEIPATVSARSGARRSASAMFVSGPTATTHVPGLRATRLDDESHSVVGVDGAGRFGQRRAVEPARPVYVTGGNRFGDERSCRPGVDGNVDAEQFAHDERVVRGAVERSVAGDGRDPGEVAGVGGDDDGDGVVVAGVAIEDDARPFDLGRNAQTWRDSCSVDADGSADPLASVRTASAIKATGSTPSSIVAARWTC